MSSKDKDKLSEPKYPIDAQNAIFNFLFILANEYQATGMTYEQAIIKACNWNISLSEHVKEKAVEFQKELTQKQKDFTQSN